jgi:hypothetical protein
MSPDAMDHLEDGAWVKILDLVEDYSFGGMFRVIRATLRYRQFDGHMSEEITRINFDRGDSVGVLLYDPDEEVVVLTRQDELLLGPTPLHLSPQGPSDLESPIW